VKYNAGSVQVYNLETLDRAVKEIVGKGLKNEAAIIEN